MAALWFSPENNFGHLESADANGFTDTGFYSRKNLYFYCLMYLDSSSADKQVPLLTLLGGSSPAPTGLRYRLILDSGIIRVEGYYNGAERLTAYLTEAIPTDELVEIAISLNMARNNSNDKISIFINGIQKTTTIASYYVKQYAFESYTTAILGGNQNAINQASGLLMLNATLSNDSNYFATPPTSSTNTTVTVWHCDFEDSASPLKITTHRNNVSSERVWFNTDDVSIVWTDGNAPPTAGGGDDAGGIIIPGNGNITQVQGVITENDLPVARRVFAFTQAQLAVSGSDQTQHAVLNSVVSDSNNGSYSLDTSPYEGAVILVAMDEYGEVWQGGTAYSVGDVIRPASFEGYVYYCVVAGTSDSTEPTWGFDINNHQSVGTAQFRAKPYSRPLAHAPIMPDIIPAE